MTTITLEDLKEALYFANGGQENEDKGVAYSENGQLKEAFPCLREALKIAVEVRCSRGAGIVLGYLAKVFNDNGQNKDSINIATLACNFIEEIGSTPREANASVGAGNALFANGHYRKAIEFYEKAFRNLNLSKWKNGLNINVERYLKSMAEANYMTGQYQKAILLQKVNLEIAKECGNEEGARDAFQYLGNVYCNIGQNHKAAECYSKIAELAMKNEKEDDGKELGSLCGILGNMFHNLGLYEEAFDYYFQGWEIACEICDIEMLKDAIGNIASVCLSSGLNQEVFSFSANEFNVSEDNYEMINGEKAGLFYLCDGLLLYTNCQYRKAIDYLSKALEVAEKMGYIKRKAEAQSGLGLCYQKSNPDLACSFFAKSILSFETIRDSLAHEDEFNTSMANMFAIVHKYVFYNLLILKQVKSALFVSDSGKAKALNDLTRTEFNVVMNPTFHDKNTLHAISIDPCSKVTESMFDETLTKVIHLIEDSCIVCYSYGFDGDLYAWVVSKKGVFYKKCQTANALSAKTYLKTVNAHLRESLLRGLPRNATFTADVQTLQKVKEHQFTKVTWPEGNKPNDFTRNLKKKVETLPGGKNAAEVNKRLQEGLIVECAKGKPNLDCSEKNNKYEQQDEGECFRTCLLDSPNTTISPDMTFDTGHRRNTTEDNDAAIVNILRKKYSILFSPIEEFLTGSKILIVPEGSLFNVIIIIIIFKIYIAHIL